MSDGEDATYSDSDTDGGLDSVMQAAELCPSMSELPACGVFTEVQDMIAKLRPLCLECGAFS